MKAKKKEKLILSLIKDDLINTKLVNSLSEAGLNADSYLLHLSDTVFKLLGIKNNLKNEFIYENYLDLTKRVKYIGISNGHHTLDDLAEEIYTYLLCEKSKLK